MGPLKNAGHERFAQAVAEGNDQSVAWEMAGYSGDKTRASKTAARPEVRGRIAELLEKDAEKAGITRAMVLKELGRIGFSDIRKAVKWRANVTDMDVDEETGEQRLSVTNQVQLVDSETLDDDTAAAIAEVSQAANGGLKIKLHDKRAALVDIGKHLGMFKDEQKAGDIHIHFDELRRGVL